MIDPADIAGLEAAVNKYQVSFVTLVVHSYSFLESVCLTA